MTASWFVFITIGEPKNYLRDKFKVFSDGKKFFTGQEWSGTRMDPGYVCGIFFFF